MRLKCEREQVDPDTRLTDVFGVDDLEGYWNAVKTNLAAERIRLVFVADEISSELRRIVEFLNHQMSDTEVFAIEVKQYVDAAGERQTIVPRVLGQTEAAKAAKGIGRARGRQWDEASFLEEIARLHGERAAAGATELLDWGSAHEGAHINYGHGKNGSALIRFYEDDVGFFGAVYLVTSGDVYVPFDLMRQRNEEPFATSLEPRDELRRRIREAIPSVTVHEENVRLLPHLMLETFAEAESCEAFFTAIEWAVEQARNAQRLTVVVSRDGE